MKIIASGVHTKQVSESLTKLCKQLQELGDPEPVMIHQVTEATAEMGKAWLAAGGAVKAFTTKPNDKITSPSEINWEMANEPGVGMAFIFIHQSHGKTIEDKTDPVNANLIRQLATTSIDIIIVPVMEEK